MHTPPPLPHSCTTQRHAVFRQALMTSCAVLFSLVTPAVWAESAPLTPEQLEAEAVAIITGTVMEVTSVIQDSKTAPAPGNQDRVFTIKLNVMTVRRKGQTLLEKPEEIDIVAWQPHSRDPLSTPPGVQGHEFIPEKGNLVSVYLATQSPVFEPIIPNGIHVNLLRCPPGFPPPRVP